MLKQLHIYAAMFERDTFTVANIAERTGAKAATVHSVIRRMKESWLERHEPVSTGKPGGQAFRYSLTKMGRQKLSTSAGSAVHAFKVVQEDRPTREPEGLPSARRFISQLEAEADPEVFQLLLEQADRKIDWAVAEVEGAGYEDRREELRLAIADARDKLSVLRTRCGDGSTTQAASTAMTSSGSGHHYAFCASIGPSSELINVLWMTGKEIFAASSEHFELNVQVISGSQEIRHLFSRVHSLRHRAHVFVAYDSSIETGVSLVKELLEEQSNWIFDRCTVLDKSNSAALSRLGRTHKGFYFSKVTSEKVGPVVSGVVHRRFGHITGADHDDNPFAKVYGPTAPESLVLGSEI